MRFLNRLKSFLASGKGGFLDSVKLSGEIELVLRDKDGRIKDTRHIKNTITNAGKAVMAALLSSDVGGTAFDYIAIGVGTPGSTALGSECTTNGGERRGGANVTGSLTTTTVTNDTIQFVTTFSFTGSLALTEEGIFNAASAGIMLASQSFSVLNVANNDTLTITHKVKVS